MPRGRTARAKPWRAGHRESRPPARRSPRRSRSATHVAASRRSTLPRRTPARQTSPPRRSRRRPRRGCALAHSPPRSPPRTRRGRRRRRMPPRPDRVGAAPALLGTRFRAPSARRARARGCLPRLRLPSVRRDRRLTRFEPPSQSRLGRHRQCRVRCSPTLLAFRLVAKGQMGQRGVQLLNGWSG